RCVRVHRMVLMKTGLILLIVGHLSFITGALLHGTVLRFVLTARDATSLHYGVTNSASVIAALLVPTQGAAALPWSLHSPHTPAWGPSCSSVCCLCCLLGLLVAIGLTLGNQGRVLLAPCSIASIALGPASRECPFDPTRVYTLPPSSHRSKPRGDGDCPLRSAGLQLSSLQGLWGHSGDRRGRAGDSGHLQGRGWRGELWGVRGAQNCMGPLGSHCSRRTMDGSLLAPVMNSSSESFPAGKGTRLRDHPAQPSHPGGAPWGAQHPEPLHASRHEPFNQRACRSF
uniref:Transmembrane protein 54 n=1 Tax=Catharus ustulatus TaxID=91951 RepID=A0A8C3UMZ0_CATUS